MPVSYRKLFMLMEQRGIKKIDLRNKYGINPKTVNSLVNNKSVTIDTIMELCQILNAQPGDLIEYVKDESISRWEKAELRKIGERIPDILIIENEQLLLPSLIELIRTDDWYDLSDDERFMRANEVIKMLTEKNSSEEK